MVYIVDGEVVLLDVVLGWDFLLDLDSFDLDLFDWIVVFYVVLLINFEGLVVIIDYW